MASLPEGAADPILIDCRGVGIAPDADLQCRAGTRCCFDGVSPTTRCTDVAATGWVCPGDTPAPARSTAPMGAAAPTRRAPGGTAARSASRAGSPSTARVGPASGIPASTGRSIAGSAAASPSRATPATATPAARGHAASSVAARRRTSPAAARTRRRTATRIAKKRSENPRSVNRPARSFRTPTGRGPAGQPGRRGSIRPPRPRQAAAPAAGLRQPGAAGGALAGRRCAVGRRLSREPMPKEAHRAAGGRDRRGRLACGNRFLGGPTGGARSRGTRFASRRPVVCWTARGMVRHRARDDRGRSPAPVSGTPLFDCARPARGAADGGDFDGFEDVR